MKRSTPEGTFIWFQLDVRPDHKIEWPLELYLAYSITSKDEPELRCQLWDAGKISFLTDQDRRELNAARPFEKSKIEQERTKYVAAGGGNRDRIGGLPIPEYAKRASA